MATYLDQADYQRFLGARRMTDWNARRILRELADADKRREILADLWRFEDAEGRLAAQAYLAKKLHFRDVTIKKLAPERKAELLAARANDPEVERDALLQLTAGMDGHADNAAASIRLAVSLPPGTCSETKSAVVSNACRSGKNSAASSSAIAGSQACRP